MAALRSAVLALMALGALASDVEIDAGTGWGWRRTKTRTTTTTTTTIPCTEPSRDDYLLKYEASGTDFFDRWDFIDWDANNGAAEYLTRDQAVAEKVVEAHDTHAILRVGARGAHLKRKTVKIQTKDSWKYFLLAARFTHVPFGCGLWPAFWTWNAGVKWPNGGELDILEFVNEIPAVTSLHTGEPNRCRLDPVAVVPPGCPQQPDLNNMNYDCVTDYPDRLGCAPNTVPLPSPAEWNRHPVTFVVEWTEDFIKIWRIPDDALPVDLIINQPRLWEWDRWLVSYYPFRASGDMCPNPETVMGPQNLVLNIGLCGDWSGKIWGHSASCSRLNDPNANATLTGKPPCRVVDPLVDLTSMDQDCCTQFIWDEDRSFGADRFLAERGFFNISWVKIFQRREHDTTLVP